MKKYYLIGLLLMVMLVSTGSSSSSEVDDSLDTLEELVVLIENTFIEVVDINIKAISEMDGRTVLETSRILGRKFIAFEQSNRYMDEEEMIQELLTPKQFGKAVELKTRYQKLGKSFVEFIDENMDI